MTTTMAAVDPRSAILEGMCLLLLGVNLLINSFQVQFSMFNNQLSDLIGYQLTPPPPPDDPPLELLALPPELPFEPGAATPAAIPAAAAAHAPLAPAPPESPPPPLQPVCVPCPIEDELDELLLVL